MDGGAKKLLESVTFETLHAHNFSRSSTQASLVLTDLLSRYLALLTTTCAKYAEHAGRLSLSIRDAVSALDELGVGVDELSEYCATEAKDLARYTTHTARRIDDLAEFRASLATGLREDRDDAIPLVYVHVPSPTTSCSEEDEEESSESEEEQVQEVAQEKDAVVVTEEDTLVHENATRRKRKDDGMSMPPASPPLPLSPISNPSSPPRKRPRTASWRAPSYIPDHLPPFPTHSPRQTPSPPQDAPVALNHVKLERPATPSPQISSSASSADYLTRIPYDQSSLASAPSWHLPSAPRSNIGVVTQPPIRLPLPQIQPALLGAYHHVLTHPPPANVTTVNPARYKVALAFLTQAEVNPRWEPAPTLFSNTAPNPPRVAAIGPSLPIPVSKIPQTPEGKPEPDNDRKPNLPLATPKPVNNPERITPLLSQQASRIPDLARQVLPGSVYTRTTRLTHPSVLQRGPQRLVYGPGVSAPWNTNASAAPAAVPNAGKNKNGGVNGLANGKDTDASTTPLPDSRLFATWDYEQRRFYEPLVVRRGRMGSMQSVAPPTRGRSESRVS